MEHFSQDIIKEIESRGIKPRSKLYFLVRRSAFWISAVVSVVIGGLSFAVGEYVFFDNDFTSLSILRRTPIIDIAKAIPYIWLVALSIFTVSAYIGFRHTRKGYKYATGMVLVVSVLASILLGLVLNKFDFGQSIHLYLLHNTSYYNGLIHSSEDDQKD